MKQPPFKVCNLSAKPMKYNARFLPLFKFKISSSTSVSLLLLNTSNSDCLLKKQKKKSYNDAVLLNFNKKNMNSITWDRKYR